MSSYEFEAKKVIDQDECHIWMSKKGVYWSKTRLVKKEVSTPKTETGNPYREPARQVEPVIQKFVIAERYIPWKSILSVGTEGSTSRLDERFTQTLKFYFVGMENPVLVPFGLPSGYAHEAMRIAMWWVGN
jgi:hypothetical protein